MLIVVSVNEIIGRTILMKQTPGTLQLEPVQNHEFTRVPTLNIYIGRCAARVWMTAVLGSIGQSFWTSSCGLA